MLPDTDKFQPKPAAIHQKKWRVAGPLGHQRSASAVTLLVNEQDSGFSRIQDACWASLLSFNKTFNLFLLII